ncbi:MAG: GNAT family N-acetyltransferase [Bacteroidota bacterium]|nr:GNAT family N-acetyltransferase [Bacteroidota bacterium]
MNIEFVYAEENDLKKIIETYNSTVASRLVTADLQPVSVESKQQWFNSHNKTNRPLWIVKLEGNYAGWMSFNSFYGRPAYDITAEVSIYLEENSRGKGLGNMCVQKAIDESRPRGIKNLLGFIFGHNEPSLKLFYKFKFEKWAHFPKVANMDGEERDLIILGLRIQ